MIIIMVGVAGHAFRVDPPVEIKPILSMDKTDKDFHQDVAFQKNGSDGIFHTSDMDKTYTLNGQPFRNKPAAKIQWWFCKACGTYFPEYEKESHAKNCQPGKYRTSSRPGVEELRIFLGPRPPE
ncbi:MAG: hypothetical protein V1767_01095 [Chloroflexota bacterium]